MIEILKTNGVGEFAGALWPAGEFPRLCSTELWTRVTPTFRVPAMADAFTPEKRSEVMSGIRGTDPKSEPIVRSMLHRLGYRFAVNGV